MQNSNLILLILLLSFFLHSQHADAQKSSWSLRMNKSNQHDMEVFLLLTVY